MEPKFVLALRRLESPRYWKKKVARAFSLSRIKIGVAVGIFPEIREGSLNGKDIRISTQPGADDEGAQRSAAAIPRT